MKFFKFWKFICAVILVLFVVVLIAQIVLFVKFANAPIEVVSFLIELSERVDGLRVEGYLPEESEPKAYINRAEKELAEEGKND